MDAPEATVKRVRRTAEDARSTILDAAQARIALTGPGGLRLQDVAADVGMAHPTVLHHFVNREGLLRAVSARTVETLREAMLTGMASGSNARLVPDVFASFRGGLAAQLAWFSQTDAFRTADTGPFSELVDALYARRLAAAAKGPKPERLDTEHLVHLVVIAAFGDALVGSLFRRSGDQAEEALRRSQFEDWLRMLIRGHVSSASS